MNKVVSPRIEMLSKSLKTLRFVYSYSFMKAKHYSSHKTDVLNNDAINLSDNCVKKLQQLCENNVFLRLCVESGGCSGFQYKFDLDTKLGDDDK